jgi:GT2 family glycosyltransferase
VPEIILSIIIVNWNTRDMLARCLASIYQHPPHVPFEVVVVDNASSDGSAAMVRERFPQVRLIENQENVGFARANNQAIQESSGEYLLLFNSDAFVMDDSLSRMVEFIETHPRVGAVGPKLLNPDGSFQASYADFPTLWSEFLLISGLTRFIIGPYAPSPSPSSSEAAISVDWVAGAALLVRRSVIEQIGLMDERFFLYSEETEWCWRIWQAGWEVWYLPDAHIVHMGGGSSIQRSIKSYQNLYKSKVRFFEKVYGPDRARLLQTLLIMVILFRSIVWLIVLIVIYPFSKSKAAMISKRYHQESALLKQGFHWWLTEGSSHSDDEK